MAAGTSENFRKFRWTKQRCEAAQLVAEGDLTFDEIAAKVGVTPRTIFDWRSQPEFRERVAKIVKEMGDAALKYAIAHRNRRIQSLNRRWQDLHRVIQDRAADPSMEGIPGGPTGLMVRHSKMIGSGDNARMVEEYEVDVGTLKELREHEKQAAQEVGQWTEKLEHSGENGGPVPIRVVNIIPPMEKPTHDTTGGGNP